MALILIAVFGFLLGKRLGVSRSGYITLALISFGAAVLQIVHLALTSNRSSMTLLPIIVGALFVAGMLAGALRNTNSKFVPGINS
jgi:hypothetical protein